MGKTSRIYTATDRQSGTPVVLKIYRKAKLTILGTFQAEREARLHLQLSHPNIIQLFGAFEDDKNCYLVQVRNNMGVRAWPDFPLLSSPPDESHHESGSLAHAFALLPSLRSWLHGATSLLRATVTE